MAHFAQIDYENKVLRVSVVRNEDILDPNGNESEQFGIEILKSIHGRETRWIQTSYNNKFRFRYAGIGMIYNVEHDVFLQNKPYPSWILNTETYEWDSPIPKPDLTEEQKNNESYYEWNEENQEWELKTIT
ncbi:hypothetical protein EBQ91_01910 [bacterium]|nr:hypothetical protein [bacterium]